MENRELLDQVIEQHSDRLVELMVRKGEEQSRQQFRMLMETFLNTFLPLKSVQQRQAETLERLRTIQASKNDYRLKSALAGAEIVYLFGLVVGQLPESDRYVAQEALTLYWDM